MINHLAKDNILIENCIYCGNTLKKNNWKSEHLHEFHYKVTICKECGKEHRTKVDFEGSGHDNWKRKSWISKNELQKINEEFDNLIKKFNLNKFRR